jgi:hypothetical protein
MSEGKFAARDIADTMLAEAMALENGRPRDDISVLVVSVSEGHGDMVRRMDGHLPV